MRLTFILASLAALSSISHAASFDCSKSPEKPAERMICQSDSLSTLDGQLAVAFKAAIKGAGADASVNDVLKSSQQRWLRYTRDACKNVQCMEKAYVSRIAFLLQWNEDAPADNKADGNYHYSHNMDFANGTHAVVEDCLNIKSAGNGQAQVNTILVQSNGHNCSLNGKFAVAGNTYTYLPGKGENEVQNCQVKLTAKRHHIILSAVGEGCASRCGAQASLANGAGFLRTDRAKQACVAD